MGTGRPGLSAWPMRATSMLALGLVLAPYSVTSGLMHWLGACQWPASYEAGNRTWTAEQYAAKVRALAEALAAAQAEGKRMHWVSPLPKPRMVMRARRQHSCTAECAGKPASSLKGNATHGM